MVRKAGEVGMTKEDAIKWLENLKQDIGQLRHEDLWHYEQAIDEICYMLKEQEPMQVKMDMYGNAYCPRCSTNRSVEMGLQRLHIGTQFCPYCGRPVKWE